MTRPQVSVLIVDDSDDHRLLMKRCLVDAGINARTVRSGDEALMALDGIDLVLLDHGLKGMSGLETLCAIRQAGGPSVVMVTGMGSEDLVVQTMHAGAIDYLVKDSQYLRTLPQTVERAWRHHDLLRRTSELQRLALLVTSTIDRDHTSSEIVHGARALLATRACALFITAVDSLEIVAFDGNGNGNGNGEQDSAGLLAAAERLLAGAPAHELDGGRLVVRLPSLEGEPLGVLAFVDDEDRNYQTEDVNLAIAFASFAGLGLQNLRRFEMERALSTELAARARELAGVAQLGQKALTGTDPSVLMAEASAMMATVLGGEPAVDTDFMQSVSNVLAAAAEGHRARQELSHQALHDPLTALPNRALLLDRLGHALARARRQKTTVGVLFLDVDRFKVVNDSLGHTLGDQLLVEVAARLRAVVRPSDTVGRFGGDEFVVICEDMADEHQAVFLAERISAAMAEPTRVGDRVVPITVSTGIVLAKADDEAESLLRDADAAMYRAKDRGRARCEVFDATMRQQVIDRLETEGDLRRAVDQDELRIVYQPEVSLLDGRVVAVEALVRWAHPERGLLTPGDFLPLAEETGLVVQVGRWVLAEACRQMQALRAAHEQLSDVVLWVNLSARELIQPDLADTVAEVLASTGSAPAHLGIEITESVFMEDMGAVTSALGALRAIGVHLAIDDFGTGFSSLTYLRRFPVGVLKVDQSFVFGLCGSGEDSAIVTAVIGLAHSLGLSAVAEGVETFEQLSALRALGCNKAQGYYFGKPADIATLTLQLLRRVAELALPLRRSAAERSSARVGGPPRAPRVLVCDDDPTTRRVYRSAFELEGAVVHEAGDGDECIAAAGLEPPDLVVLDLFMPGRDGLSALPDLVRLAPDARVLMVSAFIAPEISDQTRLLGADGCFEKLDFLAQVPDLMALAGAEVGAA